MIPLRLTALVLALLLNGSPAWAYTELTHQDLTARSFQFTTLGAGTKLKQLGLDDPAIVLPNSIGSRQSVLDLFRDGATFEDGFSCLDTRSANHFFNPLTNSGLDGSIWGLPVVSGTPSPDWATTGANQNPTKFSYRDARAQFLAGMRGTSRADRERSLGLVFQTLGHIVHHLQDMAQPQHVRNDMHLEFSPDCFGQPPSVIANALFGRPSHFENWTGRGGIRSAIVGSFGDPAIAGYDVGDRKFKEAFVSPRSFWTTSNDGSGKGIAEFTNRSFVSTGTNFTRLAVGNSAPAYPAPKIAAVTPEVVDIQDLCATASSSCGRGLAGKMTFVSATVGDRYVPLQTPNPRASSYSFFTQDLKKRGAAEQFALNRFTFDEAYKHLIPRAVAYSAGMINYFFRGDIDLAYDEKAQKYYLVNNGDEDIRGAFELYYDGKDGTRYPIAQQSWDALAVVRNSRVEIAVTFPNWGTAPAPKEPDRYILVFHGDMGEEKVTDGGEAVAARVVDLSPFVVFMADMGSAIRNVGGADFSMIVPERYETRLREAARNRRGDIVLTIGTREYPARDVSPPGANGCWTWAECDKISGSIGPDANWRFYLYRSNQVTSEKAGLTSPIIATEDFRNLYARPNATFAWICAYMLEVEASGLSITGWSQANSGEPIGLSLRDPADGSLQRLFEFKARQTASRGAYYDPYVALPRRRTSGSTPGPSLSPIRRGRCQA